MLKIQGACLCKCPMFSVNHQRALLDHGAHLQLGQSYLIERAMQPLGNRPGELFGLLAVAGLEREPQLTFTEDGDEVGGDLGTQVEGLILLD